jgi:DNA polymerase-3 subunit delta'
MTDPIMHPVTKSLLLDVIAQPPNSLGLIGNSGLGRKTLAQWLIRNITNNPKIQLDDSQFTKLIVTDNNISIKIEQIHEINNFVKLKTTGTNDRRRFVVIDSADLLTDDAQNALLKLLEEPPLDTMIILTIENPENILPTVMSRIQAIPIKKPSKDQLKDQFGIATKDFDRLYVIADGLPGLLQSIQTDPDNHPLIVALQKVRSLLAKKTYDRLISVNELTVDKNETKILLDVLVRLAKVSINSSVNKADELSADKWLKILNASVRAREALGLNANPKLTLTDLFLNLV